MEMSCHVDFMLGMGYVEAVKEATPKYTCPFCEERIKPDNVACPSCGRSLPRCSRCGKALPSYAYEADECPLCGEELWR